MTVKELIKELQKWTHEADGEMEVCVGIDQNKWADPIKEVTRDLFFSDGTNYCADRIKEDGLIDQQIIILLRH